MIKLKNAVLITHFNPPIQVKSQETLVVEMHFHRKNIMNFEYDGKTYTGTRQEIIESLKHDLRYNKQLWFGYNPDGILFFLGKEKFKITANFKYDVNDIKINLIQKALDKVPENQFKYDGTTYYGSKEENLKNIEIYLRNSFCLRNGNFCVGEERCGPQDDLFNFNLIALHEKLIKRALRKIKDEI